MIEFWVSIKYWVDGNKKSIKNLFRKPEFFAPIIRCFWEQVSTAYLES